MIWLYLLGIVAVGGWLYLVSVLKRTQLVAFHFIVGSLGLFAILLIVSKPFIVPFMSQLVTFLSGLVGSLTQTFSAIYEHSLIYINNTQGVVIMFVDSECSGVVESAAFIGLLTFFPLYKNNEKIVLSFIGILWILMANVIRILVIAFIVFYFGQSAFYLAHTIIGRVVFYLLTIVLYFNVFTRAHITKQRLGN